MTMAVRMVAVFGIRAAVGTSTAKSQYEIRRMSR